MTTKNERLKRRHQPGRRNVESRDCRRRQLRDVPMRRKRRLAVESRRRKHP